MTFLVMDLESTCWETDTKPERQEVIEIGAVKLDTRLDVLSEFESLIRPQIEPELSAFCQSLTHITQQDVSRADAFPVVLDRFLGWIGDGGVTLVTWGEHDVAHLRVDCKRHGVRFPKRLARRHLNLKARFAAQRRIRPCGMAQALRMSGLPLVGTHHRGLADARNLTALLRRMGP